MSEHYQEVCQFGYVHGQCRCPNPNKTTRRVPCTNLNHAPAIDSEPDDMVEFMAEVKQGEEHLRSLHARLMSVIEDRFWYLRADLKKEVADSLEHEVSAWLIEAAERIRSNDATLHNRATGSRSSGG